MERFRRVAELRERLALYRRAGERIAFVPTMGNLHAGHLRLVEEARRRADRTVVSIFVNPIQFGPNEDYDRYPRTEEEDCRKLQRLGVDLVFLPTVEELYPEGTENLTSVDVPRLSEILCGPFRPGHFRGVATVVAKLFNIVQPDVALFGRKDFQQLRIVQKMVRDLNFPLQIVEVETVREPDGLAMSSRNRYLSPEERRIAPKLYESLCEAKAAIEAGERNFERLCRRQLQKLRALGFRPDYFEIRRANDLGKPSPEERPLVILVAARLGAARLIDNLLVS